MRYAINNLIRDIDRKLHTGGTSLTRDFYGAVDEGRRSMLSKIKPPELTRTAYIEQALYDQVDQYATPADMSYEDIINIRSLPEYRNVDTMEYPLEMVYDRRFDQMRGGSRNIVSVHFNNGIKFLKIYNPRGLPQGRQLVINNANSLTENGTWNVGGNVVNLDIDRLNHITGTAALRFDFNNSSNAGFIQNFTLESVDITDFLQLGAVLTWLDVPVSGVVTSVQITLGSDSTNLATDLYQFTVNQPHDNNQFMDGWNLLKFPLDNLTVVGVPNPKAITYVRFDFTTTGQAMAAAHLDNIVARRGVVFEMTYNSAFIIVDAVTGIFKQFATANTDLITLEEAAYQIFMLETAKAILYESYQLGTGNRDWDRIEEELSYVYKDFKKKHKEEMLEPYQTTQIFGTMYDGYSDYSLDDNDMYGGPGNENI